MPTDLHTLGKRRVVVARAFYERHPAEVAPDLLGRLLVRDEDDGAVTVARLVESEAYREDDPASHSYGGRTQRNAVMFGPAGHLYVYFTYGMHFCMNISTETEGIGSAVLLRAAAPLHGLDRIRARRGSQPAERDLLRGPARLAVGLGIDRAWNGADVTDPRSTLRVEDDGYRPRATAAGPRVGIRHAVDRRWRFWIEDTPQVSRYTRHPHG